MSTATRKAARWVWVAAGLGVTGCSPARPRPTAEPVAVAVREPVVAPVIEPAPALEPALAAGIEPSVPAAPWPEDCPPLVGARVLEIARISANVGDSAKGAVFIVVRGELEATYQAWRDSAKARGFRVVSEHASEGARAASLIDPAGGRAHILLQRSDGDELAGMYGRGRRQPVALRGPCIAVTPRTREFDVERGAIGYDGTYVRERGPVFRATRFGHDFDADGELDLLVPTTGRAACPGDLTWTVYLARGGCFHAVGEVGPGDLSHENEDDGVTATGPRPLLFHRQSNALGDGGVIATEVRSTYTFDGARYVRSAREVTRGVCHHCAVEVCRPPPR
jgi:hypothetical protein